MMLKSGARSASSGTTNDAPLTLSEKLTRLLDRQAGAMKPLGDVRETPAVVEPENPELLKFDNYVDGLNNYLAHIWKNPFGTKFSVSRPPEEHLKLFGGLHHWNNQLIFGLEPRTIVKLHTPVPHMSRMVIIDWLRARIIVQQTDLDLPDVKDASLEAVIDNEAYDTEQVEVERIPIAWLVAFKKVRWPPVLLESARLQAGPDGLSEVDDSWSVAKLDSHLENFEGRDTMFYDKCEKNRRTPMPKRSTLVRWPRKKLSRYYDDGDDAEAKADAVDRAYERNGDVAPQ